MVPKMDFVMIGAQKSGTTTLYDWLSQHPDIFLPQTKEVLYFAKDSFYHQGESYLRPFYQDAHAYKLKGGAYVHLMYFPYVVERIYAYHTQIKIIAVLRNPVDRAYSAFWFAKQNGWEKLDSFEEALDLEAQRSKGTYREQAELTYITHGHYHQQLFPYYQRFGQANIKVLLTEDLKNDPLGSINSVLEFLGAEKAEIDFSKHSNEAALPRNMFVHQLLMSHDAWYQKAGRRLLSGGVREFIRHKIKRKVIEYNKKPFTYSAIDPALKARLIELYKPHNQQLAKLIGRDLSSWSV